MTQTTCTASDQTAETILELKNAFASFPSGVVIAVTHDQNGDPKGFTASSFSPVSLDPPLVSICLATKAECYDAFRTSKHFAVSILGPEHRDIAIRFSTRGAEKFADGLELNAHDLQTVTGAVSTLICRRHASVDCGDHVILIGAVETVATKPSAEAIVFYRRGFHQLQGLGDA